ncbi:MAG: cysteine peptidase family C39 domain-containing protein [Pseudomonadota bacterium]|nr:cysteine peptidase family C39 domain-containing protein [Pseudomonadota bacterium]
MLVYVRARKEDHFAVLSGIGSDRVRLADPSQGNRVLTRRQFQEIWNTRDDATLTGRVLAVLPRGEAARSESFFIPPEISGVPYDLLSIRRY